MTWQDCGTYWHYLVEQGTKKWLEIKKGRCSGTTTNGENDFGISKEDVGLHIAGKKQKTFSQSSLERMTYGVRKESKARRYYENKKRVKVKEMGFCIPKYDHNIGVSVDGMIENEGIIEIKCPYEMYSKIYKKNKTGYSHIFRSHYKQMQMGMAITGTKWCDYIVYSRDRKVYIERIPFDSKFWNKLYPEIVEFWTTYVKPHLTKNYPIPINQSNTKTIS
jgi:hypothetical protein